MFQTVDGDERGEWEARVAAGEIIKVKVVKTTERVIRATDVQVTAVAGQKDNGDEY